MIDDCHVHLLVLFCPHSRTLQYNILGWSLGGLYVVLHLKLRKICPNLYTADFTLIEKMSFGSQELSKTVLRFGVTFELQVP